MNKNNKWPERKDKNHRPDKVMPNMWYFRWDNRLLGGMIDLRFWFPCRSEAKRHINETYFFRKIVPIQGKELLVDPNRYFLYYRR